MKFSAGSIHDVDSEKGIFEVEKASGHRYEINFGKETSEGMPSCTCKDWLRHQLPCKHFFAIFQHRKEWQWEQLPSEYLQSAYLSMDVDSIRCHFQQRLYDRAVFMSESDYDTEAGRVVTNLQQLIEEPELYIVVLSSSSPSDQLGIFPDRLDHLYELADVCTIHFTHFSVVLQGLRKNRPVGTNWVSSPCKNHGIYGRDYAASYS